MSSTDLVSSSEIDSGAPDEDVRSSFVGGSEVYELLGFPQYGRGCPRALAYRKSRMPEDEHLDGNKELAMKLRGILARGQRIEDYIAKFYVEVTGRKLVRRTRLVRNPDHPGAGVHTDRIILAGNGRPTGDAEIKSHAEGPFLHILRDGLPYGHILQLQWSMFCTGHTWGAFILMGIFGEMPLKHFDRDRDDKLMEIFAREVDNFWNLLARAELPPRLENPQDIRCKTCHYRLSCRGEALDPQDYQRLINEREGKKTLVPVFNDELDELLADRALLQSELEALDHDPKNDDDEPGALQVINRRIKALVGDQPAILVNKHWKVYCTDNTWSGLDQPRLRVEQPEIYDRYLISKRPTGTKRLTVYALHDGKNP